MRLLGGVVLAAGVGGLASPVTSAEVRVLNWKGWGTDEQWAVAHFEQQAGIKVVHDYITSFQEMFTKLRTNPGYYDIVVFSAPFTMQAADEGLLQPADPGKLTHFQDLYEDMRESTRFRRDGEVWGVAWIWGGTTVSYDTEMFPTPPTSVEVLWDPAHANRVCWRDDAEDSVRFAAFATGQDPDDPADLEAIKEKLRALKPQIKAFWQSEDEWLKLIGAKECDLSIIWMTSVENARVRHDLPVSLIVPDEGAIAAADGLSIARDAPNRTRPTPSSTT